MWGVDSDGGDWPFFVKAPEFSRKDVIVSIPSLVPRRSGRYSICDCHKLHSAISPSILHRFSRSQWLRKALEKTFR